jgi:flagellar hook-basal body complex protein FliE
MNGVSVIRPFVPPTLPPEPAPLAPGLGQKPGAVAGAPPSATFENVLGSFVQDVNARQHAAGDSLAGLLSGGSVPLHQAVLAMEEAGLSFQLMVEVRNKLLEAYQELMRMHV